MRSALAILLALASAPVLAGCLQEPEVREVTGPTDGYSPTASFLKVHVKRDDGSVVLVDFDRRDWHVAEIARRLDSRQVDYLSVQAKPRDMLGEVLVESVKEPSDLASLYYPAMQATPEQRAEMDREYDVVLEKALGAAPSPGPETPELALAGIGDAAPPVEG